MTDVAVREWSCLTDEEARTIDRQLPVVVPVGLIEAHGPALTVGFDNESAEYFARAACELSGAILMPTLHYGFADEFRDYPGTVGLRLDTVGWVIADLCLSLRAEGFTKIVFLAGHGANERAAYLGFERAWERAPELKLACWSWWSVSGLTIHHADEIETSFALELGSRVELDRAQDRQFARPWYTVRSRAELQPGTGGVNGSPTCARRGLVTGDRDRIVKELADLLLQARTVPEKALRS